VNFNTVYFDIWFCCEKFSNSEIFCSLPDAHATVSVVENSVLDGVGNFGIVQGKPNASYVLPNAYVL
jgi:hypothetical protein